MGSPVITSPNFQSMPGTQLGLDTGYWHPANNRATRGGIPMAFQVTSPYNRRRLLLPHALVLHVNPSSFAENSTQRVERIQTRGGYVEQHWGADLTEIQCSGSTGAFMNVRTGLSSVVRQQTIAWDRFQDLQDLYHNNGSLYDPSGTVVLQGALMLMYDRGTYIGVFTSFSVEETADAPFAFSLNWTFKVTETIQQVSDQGATSRVPAFQAGNSMSGHLV
jgi:hypothetical protein